MDQIQRALVKAGRKDLAQKYYLQTARALGPHQALFDKLNRQAKDLEKESTKDTTIDSDAWVNMSNTMIAMIETFKAIKNVYKLKLQ